MEKPQTQPTLSQQDIDNIKHVTDSSDVIPQEIREQASADIIKTLENNHSLNKIWRDGDGQIIGYLAFEDFAPHEAYVKYLATEGLTTESPFTIVPDLISKAKELGYNKIHFHGFNKRLNKVLTHFGFVKTGTAVSGEYHVDHFELNIESEKSEVIEQKTQNAFEQKYLNHLIQEIEKTMKTLKGDKPHLCASAEQIMTEILTRADFEMTEKRQLILKLKLARYFQRHDTIDTNTLSDALLESSKWLDGDKGGFDRLLEVHEQKTLEKIAELRRKKAEQTGDESFNPYEALFQTDSGDYYLSRLLNMPHLEQESSYMNHCVGTSDSYISKMKRGEAEILSIRDTKKHEPILTIEYFPKSHAINQIKGSSDKYLTGHEEYFPEVIEILKKMRTTTTDTGEVRNFTQINPNELEDIKVKDYHILTENGEISFQDFDPSADTFVLRMGKMDITSDTTPEDRAKIFKVVTGVELEPNQIATKPEEITSDIKVYIGLWNPEVLKLLPKTIEHIYESFPNKKVFLKTIETNPNIKSSADAEKELIAKGFRITDNAKHMLKSTSFSKESVEYELVSFSVASLGFPQGATTKEIFAKGQELGLELCPAEVGPNLRLQYGDRAVNDYLLLAMDTITDADGDSSVWYVRRVSDGSWLSEGWATPGDRLSADNQVVFVRRKS